VTDQTKPDGTPRKLLDTSKLDGIGWRPRIRLEEGLARTYAWFKEQLVDNRHELRIGRAGGPAV
jgi:GDP-L-fucose synthase